MLCLDEPTVLYHGSNVPVTTPDLNLGAPRKDFGRGFYLTSSREQAESFARTVTRRINRRCPNSTKGYGFLSTYQFAPNEAVLTKVFETADAEWLHCVAAHRGAISLRHTVEELSVYDVIVGKVANDQTNATLLAYLGGLYGTPGDKLADDTCIRLLLPDRLHDQACLRSNQALDCLTFVRGERIWL